MSYNISTPAANISPFDVGKITGNTNPLFNTVNVNWLSLNGNFLVSEDDESYYSEACFSSNSNAYGIGRVKYSGNSSDYYLMSSQYPESSNSGAGGTSRGDDIAIHYGDSHYPYYTTAAAMTTTQDVDRANLKIIRIEL